MGSYPDTDIDPRNCGAVSVGGGGDHKIIWFDQVG